MASAKTRAICAKNPHDRTKADIITLRAALRQMQSFSTFSIELQEALCKVMRYERFEKYRTVLRKGHAGMSMYFICYGSVGVTHDYNTDLLFTQVDPILLHRGASFGELALMMHIRRKASVSCMEECEFMVVDKDDFYDLGLDKIGKREYYDRLRFLTNHSIISRYPAESIAELATESKSELINVNKIILPDSTKSKYSHFVMKGVMDIYRLIRLNNCPSFEPALNEQTPNFRYGYVHPDREYEVYARVGQVHPGGSFTHNPNDNRPFILVSKGATIIRFSADKLKPIGVLEELINGSILFPSDDDICSLFMVQNKWRFWKTYMFVDNLQRKKPGSLKINNWTEGTSEGAISLPTRTNKKNTPRANHKPAKLIDSIFLPVFASSSFKHQAH